jgi:hypothetical protein
VGLRRAGPPLSCGPGHGHTWCPLKPVQIGTCQRFRPLSQASAASLSVRHPPRSSASQILTVLTLELWSLYPQLGGLPGCMGFLPALRPPSIQEDGQLSCTHLVCVPFFRIRYPRLSVQHLKATAALIVCLSSCLRQGM